jgi:hypothetical protein
MDPPPLTGHPHPARDLSNTDANNGYKVIIQQNQKAQATTNAAGLVWRPERQRKG